MWRRLDRYPIEELHITWPNPRQEMDTFEIWESYSVMMSLYQLLLICNEFVICIKKKYVNLI